MISLRPCLRTIVLLLALTAASAASAQSTTEPTVKELAVVDSTSELESQISILLRERFKLNSSLQSAGNEADNVIVALNIPATEAQNLPQLSVHIDTAVWTRKSGADGEPLMQVISISSTANVLHKEGAEGDVLKVINAVNTRPIPLHLFAANRRVILMANVVLQAGAPMPAEHFAALFYSVLKAWPPVLQAFRQNNLLEE